MAADAPAAAEDVLRARLAAANPDLMAPREALDLVYELRELLAGEANRE
jgi:DNA mismatch repair protein MutS